MGLCSRQRKYDEKRAKVNCKTLINMNLFENIYQLCEWLSVDANFKMFVMQIELDACVMQWKYDESFLLSFQLGIRRNHHNNTCGNQLLAHWIIIYLWNRTLGVKLMRSRNFNALLGCVMRFFRSSFQKFDFDK